MCQKNKNVSLDQSCNDGAANGSMDLPEWFLVALVKNDKEPASGFKLILITVFFVGIVHFAPYQCLFSLNRSGFEIC